ncbi:hypothetical protein N657DRAFT_649558 [Parathielavia appendiculata]|uniref:Uncharacterized protein n=1 Tax=Parathielavia appendiculata TaxID=2587402 RepID=A0AAN6TSN3_9PEZI|nr:hypothetical protein N657DRAFT_649558 [Parathielavia appendiculata]
MDRCQARSLQGVLLTLDDRCFGPRRLHDMGVRVNDNGLLVSPQVSLADTDGNTGCVKKGCSTSPPPVTRAPKMLVSGPRGKKAPSQAHCRNRKDRHQQVPADLRNPKAVAGVVCPRAESQRPSQQFGTTTRGRRQQEQATGVKKKKKKTGLQLYPCWKGRPLLYHWLASGRRAETNATSIWQMRGTARSWLQFVP